MTAWHVSAHAHESTNAGSLLRQNPDLTRGAAVDSGADRSTSTGQSVSPQTEPDNGELSFPVYVFDFGGALSEEEQQRADAFLSSWRGRNVTISQLHALRDALTAVLYHGGDSLVRVVLPPQTVTGGVIHFDIARGHIESINVNNYSDVATKRISEILENSLEERPSLREVERNTRFAEEIPGVGLVTPALSAGLEPDGTIVTVKVEPGDRFYGAAVVDNAGSRQAGWRRFGVTGGVNNTLGLGDQFQATVYSTPRFMQTKEGGDGKTRLGRISFDLLTGLGASRAGIAYSRVDYSLGGTFAGLGTGSANVVSLYGVDPVIRSDSATLDITANLSFKRSNDEKFSDILQADQRSTVASLRADGAYLGQIISRRNIFQYSAMLSRGTVNQKDSDFSDSVPALVSRQFAFYKAEPSLAYIQSITPTIRASVQVRGQWASRSLDSSERLGLGGPLAVRAYDQNAASVDDEIILTIAASKSFVSLPGTSVQIFYDDARGRTRGEGPMPSGSVRLQGYGVGASYSGKRLAAQLTYAMRAGHALENTACHQTWVTVSTTF